MNESTIFRLILTIVYELRGPGGFPFEPQKQVFNFFSGPGGFSQKLQTGLDTWITVKTPDTDDSSHFIPAIMFYQPGQHHFQSNAVKRIFGLLVSHLSPINSLYLLPMPAYSAATKNITLLRFNI